MSQKMAVICVLSQAFAFGLFGAGSVAEKVDKQTFELTSTEHVKFAPGGTIRMNGSWGHLSVDGWDTPEVQITIIKSVDSFYPAAKAEEISRRFEEIRVATDRKSDKELVISTSPAKRHSPLVPPLPAKTREGVILEYRILVPRATNLIVRHDNGYVWVSDVTGELDVHSHTGDMIVMLPDPGPYSINARTAMGSVSSDFAGRALNRFLLGNGFRSPQGTGAQRVYLRMGRGSITIKKGPPNAPFEKD